MNVVQQPSAAFKRYGYLWWLNTDKEWPNLSSKIYYAAGYGGNYIVIDKEHDLVVVTRWMADDKIDEVLELIIKSIENK